MIEFVLLALGFVFLIKGADFLVEGAAAIARKFNVSDLVIGLTIVAFGTSMPELLVNIIASQQGNAAIAFGNVLGSNIANILLILGISAIIYPLALTKNTIRKEIPLSLLAIIALAILVNDTILEGAPASVLTRGDGLILLSFFAIFIYYAFNLAFSDPAVIEDVPKEKHSVPIAALMVLLGIAALYFGGEFVVTNATLIARGYGVSDALIGLTIVAIGTSLPELFTSVVATLNKNANIAVGNIVGSNLFNIFFILGVSATIRPLPFDPAGNLDIAMVVLATIALFFGILLGKRDVLARWEGIAFLLLYAAYIAFLILRG
ncbi:MAG: calcium/sodium antiporter [archaeon]|nr:calcium/sodium antiporter [archaeon]